MSSLVCPLSILFNDFVAIRHGNHTLATKVNQYRTNMKSTSQHVSDKSDAICPGKIVAPYSDRRSAQREGNVKKT